MINLKLAVVCVPGFVNEQVAYMSSSFGKNLVET